ncbi:MAG: hypothetical protein V1858_02655 [Candidatus Gottesmanbacteria bacterium]
MYTDKNESSSLSNYIEQLTAPKYWDFQRFKNIEIVLAATDSYLPAYNRPDFINLGPFRTYRNELRDNTDRTHHEWGMLVIADTDPRSSTLFVTKSVEGTGHSVTLEVKYQPGRDQFQKNIGLLHSHNVPKDAKAETKTGQLSFSGKDYFNLLVNQNMQFFLLIYGETALLALKTAATPNNMSEEKLTKRLDSLRDEFMRKKRGSFRERLVDFNKQVCIEFGMTLYLSSKDSGDMFVRVPVTD